MTLDASRKFARTRVAVIYVVAALACIVLSIICEHFFYLHLDSEAKHLSVARITVAALGMFAVFSFVMHLFKESADFRARIRQALATPDGKREFFTECLLVFLVSALSAGGGWFVSLLRQDPADWRYPSIAALFGTSLFLLIYHRKRIRDAAHWGFLIIGFATASALLIVMPTFPSVSWDGAIHFDNANALSYLEDAEYDGSDQVALIESPQGHVASATGEVGHPWWLLRDLESTMLDEGALDNSVDLNDTIVQEDQLRASGKSSWVKVSAFGYIPEAAGIWLGNVLGLAGSARLFLARMFSSFLYVLCWFFGIRYLKSGKYLASAIALIPTAIFIATNFSYDGWIVALYGYAFCRFIGAIQRPDEKLTWKDMALIIVPFLVGSFAKATFFPIGCALLFMPARKFRNTRDRALWYIFLVLMIFIILASFLAPFLAASGTGMSDTRGSGNINSGEQFAYVLSHPEKYIATLCSFIVQYTSYANLVDGFGWLPYIAPSPFEYALGAFSVWLVLVFAVTDRSAADLEYAKWRFRLATVVGYICAIALSATALYITFTAVGADYVSGMQPRYLLPLLFPFAALIFTINPIARRARFQETTAYSLASTLSLWLCCLLFLGLRFIVFF